MPSTYSMQHLIWLKIPREKKTLVAFACEIVETGKAVTWLYICHKIVVPDYSNQAASGGAPCAPALSMAATSSSVRGAKVHKTLQRSEVEQIKECEPTQVAHSQVLL